MKLSEAIKLLRDYRKGDFVNDDEFCEAIDTIVTYCEDPISKTMTQEEIIKLFKAAEYGFAYELTSQLTKNKKLVFLKEGFIAEIWVRGHSVEDVVKVIATYEYMRGAEGGAE